MSQLGDVHIVAQQGLRGLVARLVAIIWGTLGGYDEEDVDPFLDRAVPVILAGQRQSVLLTEAFLARVFGRQPLGVVPDDLIAQIRGGVTPEQVYRRPFVTTWTALQNRTPWEDAVAQGLDRATSSAEMDIQMASRATFQAAQDADPQIFGYRRIVRPGACEFCQLVGSAYIKSAAGMPLHNHCGCSLEPLTEPHKHAVFLPDGTRIREHKDGPLVDTPLPEGVAVHEHGELGPVLSAPDHHFTTEGQIAA